MASDHRTLTLLVEVRDPAQAAWLWRSLVRDGVMEGERLVLSEAVEAGDGEPGLDEEEDDA